MHPPVGSHPKWCQTFPGTGQEQQCSQCFICHILYFQCIPFNHLPLFWCIKPTFHNPIQQQIQTIQIKLGWALFVTYTIIHNYTNVFSAFNPSKCTHLEQWAADCAAPGEQSWTSFRSRDSNPQPWVTSGFKSNALSIRPTTALNEYNLILSYWISCINVIHYC